MSQTTLSPQFTALFRAIVEKNGQSAPESLDASGFEIALDNHSARIYPHAEDDNRFLIDISVLILDPDDEDLQPGRWLALHEMNALTRFTTGWWIVVDDGELIMTRTEFLDHTDPDLLEVLRADGFERAASLCSGLARLGEIEPPMGFAIDDPDADQEADSHEHKFSVEKLA